LSLPENVSDRDFSWKVTKPSARRQKFSSSILQGKEEYESPSKNIFRFPLLEGEVRSRGVGRGLISNPVKLISLKADWIIKGVVNLDKDK